jgi:uncharacterized protein (TIGR02391 family)
MIDWYLSVKNLLRSIDQKARDALLLCEKQGKQATAPINGYMKVDYEQLCGRWHHRYPKEDLGDIGRHIAFGMDCDYTDIISRDLPDLEKRADAYLLTEMKAQQPQQIGFEELLHPVVCKHSYQLYRDGHLREAVFNSVTVLYEFIRLRTKCEEDGDRLVTQALSLDNPLLVLSELETESGRNDQKGFIQIFKGVYQGIRNPKAHSLTNDLTPLKAAQYMVFASLLARRIEEAKCMPNVAQT